MALSTSTIEAPATTEAKGASFWSRLWQNDVPGYLFLLPWFIGFFGLTIGPIISSLY
ncbi:MAG TPA: ABC transporter permease, partial [Devosia sp.]|nr:ABC transporter permease [Devosia sp.]